MAYIDNPLHKKEINHINGDITNNYVDNLEWVTSKENQRHAIYNELYKFEHIFCFNKNKQLIAEYRNIQTASKAVGISASIILQELNKDVKTLSGGFYWSRQPILNKTKSYVNMGRAKAVNQYDLKWKYIHTYSSIGEAGRCLGINSSHIAECCRGKIKTYKNFIWRYIEDIVSTSGENQRECSEHS